MRRPFRFDEQSRRGGAYADVRCLAPGLRTRVRPLCRGRTLRRFTGRSTGRGQCGTAAGSSIRPARAGSVLAPGHTPGASKVSAGPARSRSRRRAIACSTSASRHRRSSLASHFLMSRCCARYWRATTSTMMTGTPNPAATTIAVPQVMAKPAPAPRRAAAWQGPAPDSTARPAPHGPRSHPAAGRGARPSPRPPRQVRRRRALGDAGTGSH